MNSRRTFLKVCPVVLSGFAFEISCGGSPTGPEEGIIPYPTRPFTALGGPTYKSFKVSKDGPLYAAMGDAGIIPGSSATITSKDTKTGQVFSGNIIYYVITKDGGSFKPENGFGIRINDMEIYDPLSGAPLRFNLYELPVYAGTTVSLTLPPRWNGTTD